VLVMISVDSINIWPATSDNISKGDLGWGQGSCNQCLISYPRLGLVLKSPRVWFSALLKTINEPASPFAAWGKDHEVDDLFDDSKREAPALKRSLEELQVESSHQIAEACIPDTHAIEPSVQKKQATEYEKRVRKWVDVYQKEGRAGNVGLVPEPLRDQFPNKAPPDLDSITFAYVCHFAEWNQKH
jgi:hypothetical protein